MQSPRPLAQTCWIRIRLVARALTVGRHSKHLERTRVWPGARSPFHAGPGDPPRALGRVRGKEELPGTVAGDGHIPSSWKGPGWRKALRYFGSKVSGTFRAER